MRFFRFAVNLRRPIAPPPTDDPVGAPNDNGGAEIP